MKNQRFAGEMSLSRFTCTLLAFLVAGNSGAIANVRMPLIFGDHMVLQQDMKIPVWGWADPNEKVSVKLGDQMVSVTAGADGKWRVDLPPVPTNSAPQSLTITGNNAVTFSDVLVGDVWLCSGQSNMEFPLKMEKDAATEVPAATDPQIRLLIVERRPAFHPRDDLDRSEHDFYDGYSFLHPKDDERSVWKVCTPEMAAQFTAVGYLFAKELRAKLNRPMGMIASYWGGSPGGAWMSVESLNEPALGNFYGDYVANIAPSAAGPLEEDALYKKFTADHEQWIKDMAANPGKPAYDAAVKKQQADDLRALADHTPRPPNPQPPIPEPHGPPSVMGPTVLYNGMIAPLMPYGIKGVLWYQGETNTWTPQSGLQYRELLSRLIGDWRAKWGEGDFPFIVIQLANNNERAGVPQESGRFRNWPWLRESQLKTLAVPNTGLAVAIDLGSSTTIHPPDKGDLAHRVALVAEHLTYGQDVVYSGPIYASMKIEGNTIRISFTQLAGGLKIGVAPWIDPATPPLSTTDLKGFSIAGADKNWMWANAKIDGNDVVVSSDQVPNPVAVRYGWQNNPSCNLYNTADLPASPFRTDDW